MGWLFGGLCRFPLGVGIMQFVLRRFVFVLWRFGWCGGFACFLCGLIDLSMALICGLCITILCF